MTTTMDGVWERSAILDAQADVCQRGIESTLEVIGPIAAFDEDAAEKACSILDQWLDNHLMVAQAFGTEVHLTIKSPLATVQ